MEKRKIGSLTVSAVGLGCNNFGWNIDETETGRVVDAALDAGINFFDTADIYGKTKSEEFLGRLMPTRRDRIVLATKFGMAVSEDKQGARPDYIRQAVEDSLRRLNTDRIDLYQLHRPDESVPIADTLGALNELVQAGKVREIGCSNFSPEQLREAQAAAGQGARFVSVQNEFSLIQREPLDGVLTECDRLNLAFLPYFPLASGLLTGKYRQGQPVPEGRLKGDMGKRYLTEENLALTEKLIHFSESRGHTILELAFSWLLSHPAVASVIAGATKVEQVRSNAAAAAWKLTEEELAAVGSILSS